jgi:predicted ATPase/DNA-binding XRE family transcriptional regulator
METSFGNWVRRRRKALDFTQVDLARQVGCSLSAIFKIEADERRPSRQIAELLADHLEIPTDQRSLFIKIARKEKAVDTLSAFQDVDQTSLSVSSQMPLSHKPLIGRELELAEIKRLMMLPQCRLLTLTGHGGIGKTHLSLVLADNFMQEDPDRPVAFTNLAPVSGREPTISAIATALGIVLYSASDRADQLIAYLRSRDPILILDNFEHLTIESGCIDLINTILKSAPKVKIMVTSREPLQLQSEWVFEVQGLPLPEDDDPDKYISNSAETLFIQRAQQADASFRPTNDDLHAIAQICKLVEGLPLGIELAAAWVRTLSCQGIAEEIQRSIHFLESAKLDLPERHRSIRATIEYSWKRLSSEEQKVLCALSIFRGGFFRQAAEVVGGAKLPILSSLVSKSLIRRLDAGRFDLHGLIQQYAWERLQEEEGDELQVWKRYSQYYVNLLAHRGQALKGIERTAVVDELITELPNLRRAWHWLSNQQQASGINQAADTLFWLYESRSNCREGIPLFDEAVQQLQAVNIDSSPVDDRVLRLALGQALSYKGFFLYRQGQHPQGREALSVGLQLLKGIPEQDAQDTRMAISNAIVFLGTVTSIMGDYEGGDRYLREGLAMKQQLSDLWGAAYCLRQIGLFAFHFRGDYNRAYQALNQSLSISKQLENAWSTAASLSQLGLITYYIGDYKQAEQHLYEALELSRVLEDRASIAFALDCLGMVKTSSGYHDEGQTFLSESISLWKEIGEKGSLAQTLNHMGNAYLKRDNFVEARIQFNDAINIASEMQTIPVLLEALLGVAEVFSKEGNFESALEIATAVALNTSASFETKSRADVLRDATEKELPEHQVRTVHDKVNSITLSELAQSAGSADKIIL